MRAHSVYTLTLTALIGVLPYLCSYKYALTCVPLRVRALMPVLSYGCFHMCSLSCVGSRFDASSLIWVLSYVLALMRGI